MDIWIIVMTKTNGGLIWFDKDSLAECAMTRSSSFKLKCSFQRLNLHIFGLSVFMKTDFSLAK